MDEQHQKFHSTDKFDSGFNFKHGKAKAHGLEIA